MTWSGTKRVTFGLREFIAKVTAHLSALLRPLRPEVRDLRVLLRFQRLVTPVFNDHAHLLIYFP